MVRPYRESDADAFWALKRGFERGLGTETGDDGKATKYEAKLDDTYRHEYLDWVGRCVAENEQAVQVAEREGGERASDGHGDAADRSDLVGYVFVLPASLSYIWDAAVLNEVYVAPAWRGTDVADSLLEAALSVAREQDLPMDRIVLDVDRENDRARAFYERWGFEHWGEMVAREL